MITILVARIVVRRELLSHVPDRGCSCPLGTVWVCLLPWYLLLNDSLSISQKWCLLVVTGHQSLFSLFLPVFCLDCPTNIFVIVSFHNLFFVFLSAMLPPPCFQSTTFLWHVKWWWLGQKFDPCCLCLLVHLQSYHLLTSDLILVLVTAAT